MKGLETCIAPRRWLCKGGWWTRKREKNLRISGIFLFCRGGNRGRVLCRDERGTSLAAGASAPRSSSPSSPKAGEEEMGSLGSVLGKALPSLQLLPPAGGCAWQGSQHREGYMDER